MLRRFSVFLLAMVVMRSALGAIDSGSTLTIGFPEGLPGYEMLANGGMRIEVPSKKKITDCIESQLKVKFVWEAYPTKRAIHMLIGKKLDMLFPMGFSEDRAALMTQSQFTWGNADYYLSLNPFEMHNKNLRIGARLGSPQHTDYAAQGYGRITTGYTYEELIRFMTTGVVDVIIIPQSVYEDQRAAWPASTIITAGKIRNTGFYVNKEDPKGILESLNTSIVRCREKSL